MVRGDLVGGNNFDCSLGRVYDWTTMLFSLALFSIEKTTALDYPCLSIYGLDPLLIRTYWAGVTAILV